MRPRPDPVGPGQESVWTYPRPPVAEAISSRLLIQRRGLVVAETRRAVRTLETSHPPTYYLPPDDVRPGILRRAGGASFCEWKGRAAYWDIVLNGETLTKVGWSYPDPSPRFRALKDYIAFYAAPFDSCTVDGARVVPQPGGFYGGWITPSLAGPFKGAPGTEFW